MAPVSTMRGSCGKQPPAPVGQIVSCPPRQNILRALDQAEETYARIGTVGFTLRERSNNEHIQLLREELAAFRELAEIQS